MPTTKNLKIEIKTYFTIPVTFAICDYLFSSLFEKQRVAIICPPKKKKNDLFRWVTLDVESNKQYVYVIAFDK